jgi:hypothetical protein
LSFFAGAAVAVPASRFGGIAVTAVVSLPFTRLSVRDAKASEI